MRLSARAGDNTLERQSDRSRQTRLMQRRRIRQRPVVAVAAAARACARATRRPQREFFGEAFAQESFRGSVGLRGSDSAAVQAPAATNAPIPAAPKAKSPAPRQMCNAPLRLDPAIKAADSKLRPHVRQPLKPIAAGAGSRGTAAPAAVRCAGAPPVVPANSFDSRFSAVR